MHGEVRILEIEYNTGQFWWDFMRARPNGMHRSFP